MSSISRRRAEYAAAYPNKEKRGYWGMETHYAERVIPTCGRIIHVTYEGDPTIPARAAIVTGIQHKSKEIFLTVFAIGIAPTLAVTTYYSPNWHWPVNSCC